MKSTGDMGRLIKKLEIKASYELDKRVNDDISEAMAESKSVIGLNVWRVKLAVAAAIIIAFGIGFFVGQRSQRTESETYLANIASRNPVVSAHPPDNDGFWRQKVVAAMQPRPYTQNRFDRTGLLETYRQYLKEKHYE